MNCSQPDAKPAFAERNIPVALSTDENYLPYVKVLINSIVANTKSGNLDIFILNDGISQQKEKEFLGDFQGRDGISVRFLDVGEIVKRTGLSKFEKMRYLSVAACYRLLLPEVLTAYDKIIYLDIDTSVCRDLGDLYAVDIGDNLFGAAIDVVNSSIRYDYAEWARSHGFVEWDKYVNTGVLLLNLAAFRKASLFDKLMPIAVEASKWFCDQDALNFVCKGRIAQLDPQWNVQVGDYCLAQQLKITKGAAYIYHFTGSKKPWSHPEHRYAYFWWRHSRKLDSSMWRKCFCGAKDKSRRIDISVIIPVFNAEPYLWECLISVLNQPEPLNMEVVCVADGSTDESLRMLQLLRRLDSRVKLIVQDNHGPGVARNTGLGRAKGRYVVFLDSDDRFSAGANLKAFLDRATADRLDILVCASNQMAEDGTVLRRAHLNEALIPDKRVFGPENLGSNLYRLTPQNPWSKLFRRRFLVDNEMSFPPLRREEDFAFVQLAYSLAERIGVEGRKPLVDHRRGVPTSCESTKDETPLLFLEGEKFFRDSMKLRRIKDKFWSAACVSSILRLAYNLDAVRQFDSFSSIAKRARTIYPSLKKGLGEISTPEDVEQRARYVERVISDASSKEKLIAHFVRMRNAKTVSRYDYDVACERARRLDSALAEYRSRCCKILTELEWTKEKLHKACAERDSMRDAAAKALVEIAELEELRGKKRK